MLIAEQNSNGFGWLGIDDALLSGAISTLISSSIGVGSMLYSVGQQKQMQKENQKFQSDAQRLSAIEAEKVAKMKIDSDAAIAAKNQQSAALISSSQLEYIKSLLPYALVGGAILIGGFILIVRK